MKFKVIMLSSTSMTLELENNDVVNTKGFYNLYVNGRLIYEKENRNVVSVYQLKPDTDYEIRVGQEREECYIKRIKTHSESICLNVKRFNAKGDGVTDDTVAIQAAVICSPDNGRVFIPQGRYKVKTIFLKSNMTLELEKGATLVFDGEFYQGGILPGLTMDSKGGEYYLGSWEGNPLDSYTSLLQGINIGNVKIIGEGTLEGQGSNWWHSPKEKKGAWRPRLVQFIHSRDIMIQGLTLQNSPSWTLHPLFSRNLTFTDLKILGPKESPNTDGLNPESCENVEIIGVYFSVGDDCIALKSGKIYLGKKLKRPSKNITIRNCSMNFGHGAVVIGSEMAGGVKDVRVSQCFFNETDRGLRIKTRRGRGREGRIENIHFENIQMSKVLTPLVINSFYFCDPDGHSEYVRTKKVLPIDEGTPYLGDFTFERIHCTDCQVAAGFFYGLPEEPIRSISLKNCSFIFKEKAEEGYPAMMDDIPKYCKAGLVFNNIKEVTMENVWLEGYEGERITGNYDFKKNCREYN